MHPFMCFARLKHESESEYKLLNTFESIKAVSDTVFDMINVVYHDKPLIFTGVLFLAGRQWWTIRMQKQRPF